MKLVVVGSSLWLLMTYRAALADDIPDMSAQQYTETTTTPAYQFPNHPNVTYPEYTSSVLYVRLTSRDSREITINRVLINNRVGTPWCDSLVVDSNAGDNLGTK